MDSLQRQLEELMKERSRMQHMRSLLPTMTALVDAEIGRLQALVRGSNGFYAGGGSADEAPLLLPPAALYAPLSASTSSPSPPPVPIYTDDTAPPAAAAAAGAPPSSPSLAVKKRVRMPIPAEKYPEYNFVGRLLGPRGATLKAMEKETGCKIMIRGRGSIRKDKESEVRGKCGWEHVFSEPLHIVIEAELEERAAVRALTRAKEAIELLLVPVPEERDPLKKQQLRDLAILNGTFRGVAAAAPNGPATIASSPGAANAASSAAFVPPSLAGVDVRAEVGGGGSGRASLPASTAARLLPPRADEALMLSGDKLRYVSGEADERDDDGGGGGGGGAAAGSDSAAAVVRAAALQRSNNESVGVSSPRRRNHEGVGVSSGGGGGDGGALSLFHVGGIVRSDEQASRSIAAAAASSSSSSAPRSSSDCALLPALLRSTSGAADWTAPPRTSGGGGGGGEDDGSAASAALLSTSLPVGVGARLSAEKHRWGGSFGGLGSVWKFSGPVSSYQQPLSAASVATSSSTMTAAGATDDGETLAAAFAGISVDASSAIFDADGGAAPAGEERGKAPAEELELHSYRS